MWVRVAQTFGWTRACSCFQLCGAKEGLGFVGGGQVMAV
jgi:hypothetical protein